MNSNQRQSLARKGQIECDASSVAWTQIRGPDVVRLHGNATCLGNLSRKDNIGLQGKVMVGISKPGLEVPSILQQ
jgi:hypothetical protein